MKPDSKDERTNVIDSTGIYFLRNLRHLDRGSGEADRGQYEQCECVFDATGAAALYRRTMVEDISINGQFFDDAFCCIPDEINRHSIKNRFLMCVKSISPSLYLRLLVPITARDLLSLGYSALFNRGLLSRLNLLWSKRELLREKRKWVQAHRRIGDRELAHWFAKSPRSIPAQAREVAAPLAQST